MKKKIFFLLILLIILGFGLKVLAWETNWPNSPLGTQLTQDSTLTELVKYLYEWGIFIGGIAVFIALLIGGFLYLTSMGNPTRMSEAKDRIFSALIGLILLFSIYLILNTINPELTVLTTPGTGVGSLCDIEADCPTGYKCFNDPNPGDGDKQGNCIIKIEFGCDTESDCSAGYKCKDDPNPGDGNKEGKCYLPCNNVTFYDNVNLSGSSFTLTPTTCQGYDPDEPKTILSIDINGGCFVSLYRDDTTCGTLTASVGGDVKNLKENYGIDPTTFKSIKIEEFSSF